ncbi:MAG TPA: endonuclease/exonuclease/phosphatase family protein, partial [Candidatus Limnocylindrales bacterium]|nr:endonuclease/exonuclease/phosphatase family protein [Candidatus Limnocylindrales bacterium]
MSSLRVLTYNTQCRSWGMEAGAQGSLFPVTSTEERARAISRRIKNSYRTWDVVCLQEVFDEDARDVFIDELNAEFPHQVRKCDVDELGLQLGATAGALAAAFSVPAIGWLAAIGIAVGAIATLLDSKYEDSGLMIFSRLPFVQDPIPAQLATMLQEVAPSLTTMPRVVFIPFEDATDADASAAKGVVYAAIKRHDGGILHLLNSHTQADPTDNVGKNADTRRKQLDQVLGLIDQFASSQEEVLFVGDLNIDGTHRPDGPRQEWKDRFATGGSRWHGEFIDAWFREQCPGDITFTGVPLPAHFDRGATAGDQRLDYLIRSIPPFEGRLIAQHMAIPYEVANDPNGLAMYTSDHLPLSI